MKIDIIDIGIGNISSIENWLIRSNINYNKVVTPDDLTSDLIILPGVGSAKIYSEKLKEKKFNVAIANHLSKGGRLIGICLGFQILYDFLEEDGGVKGLGILAGRVEQLSAKKSHTGWENLIFKKKYLSETWKMKSFTKSKKTVIRGRVFYNHNYGVVTSQNKITKIEIPNYNDYVSIVTTDQIVGFQFHPEKSQWTGQILIEMIY